MPLTAPTPHSGPLVDLKMIRELLEQHRAARIDQIKAYTFADLGAGGATLDPAARRRALTAARLALDELDLALARLDDGSFGMCLSCAGPIRAAQLYAVPHARFCQHCAVAGRSRPG
jgi:DnaK suppressor protein